jgi:hypothetical protein
MADGTVLIDMLLDSSQYDKGLKNAERAIQSTEITAKQAVAGIASAFTRMAGIVGVALGTAALVSYAKESIMLAARIETLGIVINEVGKNAGYTTREMDYYVESVKKNGITTSAAMDSITKMAQAQLDLSQASKLARISQDAAVIGNTNSSEAFQRMIWGIKTGQTEILRTMGLNVNFEQSYAKLATQLHKNAAALNEGEKTQARMNEVVEYGVRIQGVYEASLGAAGKQIQSMKRYVEELQLGFGQLFGAALKQGVFDTSDLLKDMNKQMDEMKSSGVWEEWGRVVSGPLRIGLGAIENILKSIWNIIQPFAPLFAGLAPLIGVIGYGLGGILAIAVPISKAIANTVLFAADLLALLASGVTMIGQLATGQIAAAKETWNAVKGIYATAKERASETVGLMTAGVSDAIMGYQKEVDAATAASKKRTATEQAEYETRSKRAEYYNANKTKNEIEARAKADDISKNAMAKSNALAADSLVIQKSNLSTGVTYLQQSNNEILAIYKRNHSMILADMKNEKAEEKEIISATREFALSEAIVERQQLINQADLVYQNTKKIASAEIAEKARQQGAVKYDPEMQAAEMKMKMNDAANKKKEAYSAAEMKFREANATAEARAISDEMTLRETQRKESMSLMYSYYSEIDKYSEESFNHQLKIWEEEGARQATITNNLITQEMYIAEQKKKYTVEKAGYEQGLTDAQTQNQLALLDLEEAAGRIHRTTFEERIKLTEDLILSKQNLLNTMIIEGKSQADQLAMAAALLSLQKQLADIKTQVREDPLNILNEQVSLYDTIEGYEKEAFNLKIKRIEEIAKKQKLLFKLPEQQAAIDKKAIQDTGKLRQIEFDRNAEMISSTFGQWSNALENISNLYEKGSSQQKMYSQAAQAFALVQQGINTASAVIKGVEAVINAMSNGDPYTAVLRAAAVAAVVAGYLAKIGTTFGTVSGSGVPAPTAAYSQNTTVLGGINDQSSESISKSWELLQDTYDMEDTKLTNIYNEMKNLNQNITGVVKAVVLGDIGNLTAGQLAAATPGWKAFDEKYYGKIIAELDQKLMDAIDNIPIIGGILGDVINFLVGGSGGSKSLSASGISVKGGSVNAYDVVHTAGVNSSWGFGGRDPYDTRTDRAVSDSLTTFFYGPNGLSAITSKMFYDVAEGLGKNGADASRVITDAFLSLGDINLMGADTSDKIEAKIREALSKLEDMASRSIFGDDFINKYIKTNEAAAETVFRLYIDLQSVTEILGRTGESIISVSVDLSESLIEIAGGLDKLQEAADMYYDKFFSDAEKQVRLQGILTETMAASNLPLMSTRAGYKAVVEEVQKAMLAGSEWAKNTYVKMLQMSEYADQYYSVLEDASSSYQEAELQLMELQGKATEALAIRRQKELDVMDESLKTITRMIWLQQDLNDLNERSKAISEWMSSMNRSALAPANSMEAMQTEYGRLKGIAAGPGATSTDTSNFLNFAQEYLTYMKNYGGDYKAIYEGVMEDASTLKTGIDTQIDLAQKQLDALDLIKISTAAMAAISASAATSASAAAAAALKQEQATQAQIAADKATSDAAANQKLIDANAAAAIAATVAAQPVVSAGYWSSNSDSPQWVGVGTPDWSTYPYTYGAMGYTVSMGNILPFKNGGIYDSPHIFPLANGGTGMMGEAGPEAIMPLKRGADGKLGVASSRGSNVQGGEEIHIHIHNETDGREMSEIVAKYIPRSGVLSEAIRRVH